MDYVCVGGAFDQNVLVLLVDRWHVTWRLFLSAYKQALYKILLSHNTTVHFYKSSCTFN